MFGYKMDNILPNASVMHSFWRYHNILVILEMLIFLFAPNIFSTNLVGMFIMGSNAFWMIFLILAIFSFFSSITSFLLYYPVIGIFFFAIFTGFSSNKGIKHAFDQGVQIPDIIIKRAKKSVLLSYSYVIFVIILIFVSHFSSLSEFNLISPLNALLLLVVINIRAVLIFYMNPDLSYKPQFFKFLLISFLCIGILTIIFIILRISYSSEALVSFGRILWWI